MAKSSFKLEHPLDVKACYITFDRCTRWEIRGFLGSCRYLVLADLTVVQFVYVVRKRIKLSAEKAIFVFVKKTLPPTAAIMFAIYEENKNEDGFLYMTYNGENTFGSR